MTRTIARTATALALALTSVVLVTGPVEASAYRFWTYWQASSGSTQWAFANQGPGTAVPSNGAVEGWAYALSTESGSQEEQPQPLPDFEVLCSADATPPGMKRVGLVVDPGPASIAPEGEEPIAPVATCIEIEADATGYDVLRSVLDVRTENGLVCGIGGYPGNECAPVLSDAEVMALKGVSHGSVEDDGAPDASDSTATSATEANAPGDTATSTGSPLVSVAVIGLLAVAVLAFVLTRRRRQR